MAAPKRAFSIQHLPPRQIVQKQQSQQPQTQPLLPPAEQLGPRKVKVATKKIPPATALLLRDGRLISLLPPQKQQRQELQKIRPKPVYKTIDQREVDQLGRKEEEVNNNNAPDLLLNQSEAQPSQPKKVNPIPSELAKIRARKTTDPILVQRLLAGEASNTGSFLIFVPLNLDFSSESDIKTPNMPAIP